MALSNMLKEPRREIIETVIGVAVVGTLLAADYLWAAWVCEGDKDSLWLYDMAFVMAMGVPFAFAGYVILIFIHFVGEVVCDALDRRGIYLRPKQRY